MDEHEWIPIKKPTFKEYLLDSITQRRISLLDLGLITGFLALLSTITAILIGVLT
jgi:hypothetical protein